MRISVERLTKRFGPLAVVSGVSLSIREGELFANAVTTDLGL